MILLIDNYDSFSYNLYQLIGEFNTNIKVIRNDEMNIEEIKKLNPEKIILSPGPKRPKDAGVIIEVIKVLGKDIPILGVCLGHQAICSAFKANITYAKKLMHGKQSKINVDNSSLIFKGCERVIDVARYHSLCVDPKTINKDLIVIATTFDEEVMAVKHKDYPIYGLQFHPESIMTPSGKTIIKNFIEEINR